MFYQSISFNIFIFFKTLIEITLKFFNYYFYTIKNLFKDADTNFQGQN